MIKILNQNAAKKNIQLINKIDSQTKVNADINMLRSVFQNLITNGIKYTETDGVVTISASEREDLVEISITDNGIGMDSEQISNVFQFKNINSTDGTLGERGTGLGLILCKEFIEKNSGKIWFESELGKGTKFFFTLQKAV
ncbi:MAG: HAMP domain-containing sensor histidine kinase [Ignavibacteria bacterium]|nr:HAMP domain-containing sensor histidine kinase [Ignavibacteria bacterium]